MKAETVNKKAYELMNDGQITAKPSGIVGRGVRGIVCQPFKKVLKDKSTGKNKKPQPNTSYPTVSPQGWPFFNWLRLAV